MTKFSELKTKTGAGDTSCIRRRIACCWGRNERVNCRPDNWKGVVLCTRQKPREGVQLHLQGWHDEEMDVPWIFSIKRIGKLDAFSSHLNRKLGIFIPNIQGMLYSVDKGWIYWLESQKYAAADDMMIMQYAKI